MLSPEMWYNSAFTPNMMMPTFASSYNIQPYETNNDENHPPEPTANHSAESSSIETYEPQQTKFQQKSDSSFEDEESRRNQDRYGVPIQSSNSKSATRLATLAGLKYRERRNKNNMAAKKSRLNRRERENRLQRMVTEYEKQIAELSKRLELCMQELSFWRKKYGQPFGAMNSPPTPPSCQNPVAMAVEAGTTAAAVPTTSDRILCPSSMNILQPQAQFLYPTMQCS
uniref:BZIP domain-containing protein n=1 Tax=Syphacia muris TaxID=451379 RepID=A0A0N5AB38_9BILA